jgi:serine/threonine protein kinase
MDINCKDYNEPDCKTLNANCKWANKRGCIRRDRVLKGKRFRYTTNGDVEEIKPSNFDELITNFEELNFVYNPDFDRVVPKLQRKTLGAGTYGITFIPAMDCTNGQRYPKSLGKVFYSQKSADEEWAISQQLKKAEHRSQKYFSYPRERCEIDVPKGKTQPERELLEFLKTSKKANRYTQELKILPQLVMEYSGMTIYEYFEMYYKPESIGRSEFIKIFENLFYAVKQLQKHGLVHQDIKSDNVVISNKYRLRLIDFGMTKTIEDFYDPDKNILLSVPYHGVAPPEDYLFQLYNFEGVGYETVVSWLPNKQDHYRYYVQPIIIGNSVSVFVETLRNIVRGAVDVLKFTLPVRNILKENQIDSFFNEFLKNCQNIKEYSKRETRFTKQTLFDFKYYIEEQLIQFWKENQFALKSDLYSIGKLMISQSYYLMRTANDDPQAVSLFKDLMYGLLNPVPTARINITEAINLVKELKNLTTEDPFRLNKDPVQVTDIFMQFGGKTKLAILNSEIKYLNSI